MNNNQFDEYIAKYVAEDLNEEDLAVLRHSLNQEEFIAQLDLIMQNDQKKAAGMEYDLPASKQRIRKQLFSRIDAGRTKEPVDRRVNILNVGWLRYAAAIIVIAGTAAYFYITAHSKQEVPDHAVIAVQEIPPGGNRATLTLADGSIINLDSIAVGKVAVQQGSKISKPDASSIAYDKANLAGRSGFNTVTTPKGGQYQVILPDGSRAWLNAASSIRFSTNFEKKREVMVSGEVYFEVKNDKISPFTVSTGKLAIEVLGTQFNVNSYQDEPVARVSLVKGSVKVDGEVLKPGQAYADGKIVATSTAQDIAWKNGVFDFNKVSLEQAMRQISKWYDVEVIYPKGVPKVSFWGEMGRNLNLSELLELLGDMGIHFKQEPGRRLLVTQ